MVARDEEWGPWIEHDGKGCPCIGEWVLVQFPHAWLSPDVSIPISFEGCAEGGESWEWGFVDGAPKCFRPMFEPVIRYRIRKPRGLQILEGLLENLDAPKPVEVPA